MAIQEIENFNPFYLLKFLKQEAKKAYDCEVETSFDVGMAHLIACVRKYFDDEFDFDIAIRDNNGWIGVDDMLPNPEQEINYLDDNFEPKNFYLVQLKNGLIDTVYYATICNDCEYINVFISCTVNVKENQYFAQERGFNDYRIDEVKCWQHLPQPPKE